MDKKLKYLWLMEEVKISNTCPYDGCHEGEIRAYRWAFNDIDHSDNFLPKKLFDKNRNYVPRQNSANDKFHCSCCALSMYNSLESALSAFKGIPERPRNLLGYTHVAEGELIESDGKISQIDDRGHFDLFEYEGIELQKKFVIIRELS